jgi:hypothetical protein
MEQRSKKFGAIGPNAPAPLQPADHQTSQKSTETPRFPQPARSVRLETTRSRLFIHLEKAGSRAHRANVGPDPFLLS